METSPASAPCRIEWFGRKKPIDLPTSAIDAIREILDSSPAFPRSITCDWPVILEVFEHLAPLADGELEELKINEVAVRNAVRTDGSPTFVPDGYENGIEVLASGSSTWLPGGPCVFEQHETILKFNDLYWVNTTGDLENQVVSAGRFEDPIAGLRAAVSASLYCWLLDDLTVHCELNDGPQEE